MEMLFPGLREPSLDLTPLRGGKDSKGHAARSAGTV